MDTYQKYKIRPGTVDSGKEYEVKVVALLSLRCVLHGVDDMWIASNADGVGDFDDIILHVKTAENDGITFMMQLKHKDNRDNIKLKEFLKNGDFLLKKYSEDISNLQQSISSHSKPTIVQHLGQFDNIYFIFFTNRGETKNSEILQSIYNPDESKGFLKDLLNTNTTMNSLFGFNIEKLPEIASNNNFKNVFLLANQLSSQPIDKLIADKIKEIVDPAGVAQVDFKDMAQNFMQYVKNWSRGTLGGHYYLTKQDVLTKISDLFLAHYAVNFRQNQFNFYDCNKKNIWNQIMCHETITIVDSNDLMLEFLVEYIGSEVKKHCDVSSNKFWCEHLYGQAQSLFYQRNQDLKNQMLKIVGNIGKITLLDVYKCLWMVKKLPLLLEVKKIQDFENILHVLKLTNYAFKAVVVNNSTENVPSNQFGTTFCTLQDLHSGYKDAILKLPIRLQGRAGVALGSVVDENMHHYIKCKDIINILLDNFNIGNNLEQLPTYFIERSLIKTFITTQALRKIKDEVFLLDNRSNRYTSLFPQNDFNACKLEDVDYNNLDNYRVILVQENDILEKTEWLKSANKTIHNLFIHDANYLEWKWTLGSTKKLGLFQIQLHSGMYQKDIAPYYFNAVNIVNDDPGMGKTTLMNFIEHQAPTDKWVLKINLNKHQRYYRKENRKNSQSNGQKHLRYFNDLLRDKDSCNVEISQKVFEKLLNSKSIIVLMDGFDEISTSYKDEVTEMAKCLSSEGYHIWLTTRPHMKSHLEEEFEAFSLTLKPFDLKDQEQFFTRYFTAVNYDLLQQNSEILFKQFVQELLEASKENLSDEDAKFAGIPLQSKLLAEAFNEDCRNYLISKGVMTFNKNFDLLDLYQNFIDRKFDIFCEKFGENAVDTYNIFRKHQFHFALKYLFRSRDLQQLDIENEFNNDYKKEPKIIQFLQRDGVIMVDEKFNVSCTHQTFAEYLAALWLTENVNSENEKIKETVDILYVVRFSKNYEFLFKLFDRILTKTYPLHSAVLNSRTGEVIDAIKVNPNILKDVDDGNRSVLHIIALYSKRFPEYEPYSKSYNKFIENQEYNADNMLDVINSVPNDVILDIEIDAFGYSPFDYALAYGSLTVANRLHGILKSSILKLHKDIYLDRDFLCYSAAFNYEKLFAILLPYFVSKDLLLNRVNRDSNIATYISDHRHFKRYRKLQNFVKNYKGHDITLLELLHSADGYPYTGYMNSFYSDLRYAIIYGTEKNVTKLISKGQNINKKDIDDYTSLHYAILNKKIKIAEILIDNGANVNAQTSYSKVTPLHLAIGTNQLGVNKLDEHFNASDRRRIVAKLLSKNANANSKADLGNSPLHDASMNGYTDIVTLLIEKGANTNIKTCLGRTPLRSAIEQFDLLITHYAKKTSHRCALTEHLNGDIKNIKQSVIKSSFVPCLHERCHYCTIATLLSNGADINEQDDTKDTPLHVELNKRKNNFNIKIAKLLLIYDADVNKQNLKSQTVLHYATIRKHNSILSELLNKGADVNIRDAEGNTPLHLAKNADTAYILISNGADVNAKNNIDKTPCHCACEFRYHSIIEELIARSADINQQDKDGHTALHYLFDEQYLYNPDSAISVLHIAKLLLDNGADINRQDKNGETALHVAVRRRYYQNLNPLLSNGANINIQDNNGNTPLHFVSYIEVATLLIAYGANTNIKNNIGEIPPELEVLVPHTYFAK